MCQAKNVHEDTLRDKMATFMCHDPATADRFYALSLSVEQSRQMRANFQRVASLPDRELSLKARKPKGKKRAAERETEDSTSEDETKAPYQESGDSYESSEVEDNFEEENEVIFYFLCHASPSAYLL